MEQLYPKLIYTINTEKQLLSPKDFKETEIEVIWNLSNNPTIEFLNFANQNNLFPICTIVNNINSKASIGIYLDEPNEKTLLQKIEELKRKNKETIVICDCKNSYDLAMLAGDAGADVIAFKYQDNLEELLSLLETWNNLTVIQSLLLADHMNEEELNKCLASGIDFIAFPQTFNINSNNRVEKIQKINNLLKKYPFQATNFNEE
ncbi:hypothetical protein [Rickettsiales endosymbiont of Stachyamoeba lipophora]|uniref:hypothetical protein n=1 Tax=Rickettsiales endosymbiont of Stachyamoeba lipophora TaxID=2486578 RepID=UPI000F646183|nr:hypothetical protein [Rickettsiales endosymbiont of Stachyamoeba lipophora]AZL16179.1 hypothetical protein EF513_06515 [Rickettsiales endosymbiont of Stachyamoeba lipophora]